jgi:alpha-N-arabinofuranosidase
MKVKILMIAAAAMWLGSQGVTAAQQVPDRLSVSINTTQTSDAVTKYEFGQFIEHIVKTMYSSLWAEMIDDRKFFFPITAKEPEPSRLGFGGQMRRWTSVGLDQIEMDKKAPFVGDQSPVIQLDARTLHGIRQTGLGLVKGKLYTGRIFLKGAPGAKVNVSLIWGDGASDKQTISIPALAAEYKKYPLSFTSKADTQEATIEITGAGSGSYHIGAISLMPADNIQGFRPDTTALLRKIPMGFWRYGGNYTSNLIWYHIVGDIDKRPPDWDYAWNAMQTNDLGLDEFMTLCKLINVEPYISVNAGLGDSHSAAEEVEYMNGAVTTLMGAQRAKNGHPAPYSVKLWNIGNEPWGSWQIGRTDLKYFMIKHNEFAKAMRQVDPSITLIASGMMLQDDNVPNEMRAKYVGHHEPMFGGDHDWTGGFMRESKGNFDIMAEHWYAQGGHHWDQEKARNLPIDKPSDDAFVKVDMTPLESARYAADTVRLKAEEWKGYEERFPWIVGKIKLSIDEYAYFGGGAPGEGPFGRTTIKQALAYAMVLNEMMRYTNFLTMGAQTTGVSLIDFNKTASTMNALGLLYQIYGDQFVGAIPVELTGNSPQPAEKYPAGGPDTPAKSSGSATYPLDVFAALSADKKSLIISVANATDAEQKFDLSLTGSSLGGPSKVWQMTASSPTAYNHVGEPAQITVKETSLGSAPSTISVAPFSITIYRLPVAQAAM